MIKPIPVNSNFPKDCVSGRDGLQVLAEKVYFHIYLDNHIYT